MTKSGHTLISVNKPRSYSSIRFYFKASLKDIVPDISLFSTHSLRAGGASAAANAGVADRFFQRHGRWKTVSAKYDYVDDSLDSRLSVSKNLGIYSHKSCVSLFHFPFFVSIRKSIASDD